MNIQSGCIMSEWDIRMDAETRLGVVPLSAPSLRIPVTQHLTAFTRDGWWHAPSA